VLEAAPQLGGRIGTEHVEGALVDTGAQFIGPATPYTNITRLVADLGLSGELQETSHHAALVGRGRVHAYRYGSASDFFKLPVISLASKMRIMGAFGEVKRHSAELDFHALEKAASLDDEDITHYVPRIAGRDVLDHLIQPLVGVFYYYPCDGISRVILLTVLHGLGELGSFALRGGNGRFSQALAAGLDVTSDAPVHKVALRKNGSASVSWREKGAEKTESADLVVMAAPGDIAAGICKGISSEEAEFLASVRYTPCVMMACATTRLFGDRVYGAAIAASESALLAGVTFEQNKSPDRPAPGEGLTLAFLNPASSEALLAAPEADIVTRTAAEIDRFWPGHRAATRWNRVYRHSRATPLFGVSSVRRLKAFLERPAPSRGIVFCGDYLSGPHLEGAVTSGLKAAAEARRQLSGD